MRFFTDNSPLVKFRNVAFRLIQSGALTSDNNLCKLDIMYAGKELLARGKDDTISTKYLDDIERKKFLVKPTLVDSEPTLFFQDGKVVDTTDYTSKFGNGLAAYAIDAEGNLYIHEHVNIENYTEHHNEFFFHSSFLSGKPGICFGMIQVNNGTITYMDNRSGHYKPNKQHLANAIEKMFNYFAKDAQVFCKENDGEDDNDDLDLGGLFFNEESNALNATTPGDFLAELKASHAGRSSSLVIA
jgi:hypothetical protein